MNVLFFFFFFFFFYFFPILVFRYTTDLQQKAHWKTRKYLVTIVFFRLRRERLRSCFTIKFRQCWQFLSFFLYFIQIFFFIIFEEKKQANEKRVFRVFVNRLASKTKSSVAREPGKKNDIIILEYFDLITGQRRTVMSHVLCSARAMANADWGDKSFFFFLKQELVNERSVRLSILPGLVVPAEGYQKLCCNTSNKLKKRKLSYFCQGIKSWKVWNRI